MDSYPNLKECVESQHKSANHTLLPDMHQGDNKGRHSANHTLLPDMYQGDNIGRHSANHTLLPDMHQGENKGRHSANHKLLPNMHLHMKVLCVITCHDSRLAQDGRQITIILKSCEMCNMIQDYKTYKFIFILL